MARPYRGRSDNDDVVDWDEITLAMPWSFAPATSDVARRYRLTVTEYCRRALLMRLAADGVRLEDYW
jgi:hypothetical protein